jgi:hypothetical protein
MKHKKHTSQLHQKKSHAFMTVVALSATLVVSAFSIPLPQHTTTASSELDLDTVRQVCSQAAPATSAYGDCQESADRMAALRVSDTIAYLNPPYQAFSNCREAVDYIFQDRVDYPRAVKVVFRESTNNPSARRSGSQYAGCAQLSASLQRLFLKGPWNDPYYNVLALRDAVDHPRWGWCHWDLVNYCGRGGEF